MSRIAAIDLGTNTVRILVVDVDGEGYSPLFSDQIITRLGQSLHETGRLAPEAMKRATEGVAELIQRAESFAPFSLSIIVTSAGREAANIETLDAMIRSATGHGIKVISGREEARLSLKGVALALDEEVENFVLLDIGGGSSEYILSRKGEPVKIHSVNLGVVRLAETHLTKHPVVEEEYNRMAAEIERSVDGAFRSIGAPKSAALVGTAGTITSLAAIALNLAEYSPAQINNYRLTAGAVEAMRLKLSIMTIEERSRIPALRDGREDLIIPGVAIVQATLKRAGADYMLVSDYGLREGLILDILGK